MCTNPFPKKFITKTKKYGRQQERKKEAGQSVWW
jgi:hypothetical protein